MKKVVIYVVILALIGICIWMYINPREIVKKVEISNIEIVEDNNPIDKVFTNKLNYGDSTYEINQVMNEYLTAWKDEFSNVVLLIQSKMKYEEDKQYFADYYKKYEELAIVNAEIEHLNWVDISESVEERFVGTGANASELMVMVRTYKEGTLKLIEIYNNGVQFGENPKYEYIYQEER